MNEIENARYIIFFVKTNDIMYYPRFFSNISTRNKTSLIGNRISVSQITTDMFRLS